MEKTWGICTSFSFWHVAAKSKYRTRFDFCKLHTKVIFIISSWKRTFTNKIMVIWGLGEKDVKKYICNIRYFETRITPLTATFPSFVQGDTSINDYTPDFLDISFLKMCPLLILYRVTYLRGSELDVPAHGPGEQAKCKIGNTFVCLMSFKCNILVQDNW